MDSLNERLHCAAKAIRDDIRGVFRASPDYRDYLANLMTEAATALSAGQEAPAKEE